ncbi:hypothetical protein [Paenisporosarcina sp. TG20]|uniref:hypothetical protein n=1 Tax=Paenisporosarcina sp. TG20 TaxID=1211706 RepID=UPI0002F10F0E|nr:hypothetical protein [Paenisporosarcina sp. TG20]
MNLLKYLIENYGYDEPIFLDEIQNKIDINYNTLRQNLKRLTDSNQICRYEYKNGIYFISNPDSILTTKSLSVNKIIDKKYLYRGKEVIGYISGLAFANKLHLTTQNPSVVEIVTNVEKMNNRIVHFNKRRITIRKPRVNVNKDNYKILQVLDLLNNFEYVSVEPMSVANKEIVNYLGGKKISVNELNGYLRKYPSKTAVKLFESEVYDDLTQ